ncbi:hypothetical protein G6O67_004994 [Ophiocordyceps sinensis]|uniref:Transmembrane protein n=1 Tax=Ophiocordyceps sinensis TaxID=72228 RepID=A0A8H4PQQ8_9HYPO|nr:hypothetical protein G6O67_004994 [Ophiocordyceps sinensis]
MLSPGVQESCMNLTHDRLEPNPDISGIGVLISFTATAFMVLLLVWAKYLISFDPGKNPFQPGASLGAVATTTTPCRSWHSNTADESFLAFCRSLGARLAGCLPRSLVAFRSADFDEAFDETIVAMCDMQIFTGGGILLSGFLTLRDKISAHHWHVLVYLAWFSTTSHLAGLTAIRSYLNAFPRKRNLRLGLMLIVLAMLLAAMVPTQFLTWDDAISVYLHDSPALCFFDLHLARRMWHKAVAIRNHERYGITTASEADEAMAKGTQGVVLSALVLVLGLFIRSLKIFSPLSGFFAQRVRRKLREFSGRFLLCLRPHRLIGLEAQDKKPSFLHAAYAYCLFLPAVATFFSLRLWLDLFCSVMAQMLWFLISMLWGLGKLVEARRHGFSQTEAEESSQVRGAHSQRTAKKAWFT